VYSAIAFAALLSVYFLRRVWLLLPCVDFYSAGANLGNTVMIGVGELVLWLYIYLVCFGLNVLKLEIVVSAALQ
jgi:hypothetical protein